MLTFELEKLVRSLSATEKKHFQLHCSKLEGPKDYLLLYELAIDQRNGSDQSWEQQFRETYPSKSFENTASYLYKVLTDVLIQIRIGQDTWYAQHHYLMKARLCFERSMPNRAHKALRKAHKLATENQNHAIAYQASRMELTALADVGFPALSEQQLVDKQMKAKHTLQSLRQLHEHYSLYELLSHRLTKEVLMADGKSDQKINDLILSELSLTTRGSQHQFEPQKLHLLFQSFFFIHTGEYRSALRIFNDLNTLIESNEPMWDYPPYDYLSALDGILDSLRSIGYYQEMALFIDRAAALSERPYPDHFSHLATLTVKMYRLNMHIGTHKIDEALALVDRHHDRQQTASGIEGHEKQLEYDYFEGLAYFLAQQWSKANRCINRLLTAEKRYTQLAVFRAARLLHILISYEQDDLEYLDYEIRSYKRVFSKFGKAYKTEKLVFNTIASDPKRRGNAWKEAARKKIATKRLAIQAEKREMQLLKYFDFAGWATGKHR
ncbi:hypothetical protein [Parapedobacter sp. 10938]|uniref:hypothetical protein n=1 Tax=Parapedobacter flavus TaxID=3110225 RepID=UPI002DB9C833|nr:hypothetical protein [Parapedobacter sp. 10938]MEC3880993.1 hypothetical protein [Parapedobacter sp. 10938]